MWLAIEEAGKALAHDDVPVGAVVVHQGEVVGAGHNERERPPGPDGARRDAGAAGRRPPPRELGGCSTRDLRHARAVRDVRGGDRARPRPRAWSTAPRTRRPVPRAACSTCSPSRVSTTARWSRAACWAAECAALLTAFFAARRGLTPATLQAALGGVREWLNRAGLENRCARQPRYRGVRIPRPSAQSLWLTTSTLCPSRLRTNAP